MAETKIDIITDEYAATYYVYLSQHEIGKGMRQCAESILDNLGPQLATEQKQAFLDVPALHPQPPANEEQLALAERGREWLQKRAPKFVTESDAHFQELMQQVRLMAAKTRR